MIENIVTCHGCGSKWEIPELTVEIVGILRECPLCIQPEEEEEK